jgi:uncharacterized protein (AIM24 family)
MTFVLLRLTGPCTTWVELGGEVETYDLAAGQTLQVHPEHVGMAQESVSFDIALLSGIAGRLFGGDGLFVARLTGPGKVWLQTLTVPHLAHALAPYLGADASENIGAGAVGGIAGAVLRNVLGGNR